MIHWSEVVGEIDPWVDRRNALLVAAHVFDRMKSFRFLDALVPACGMEVVRHLSKSS